MRIRNLWRGIALVSVSLLGMACSHADSSRYYDIHYVDKHTVAIGEPEYYQKNYNYLILGESQAILFDSGPGVHNVRPVIESLTSLPVIAAASHLHFDHIGNHHLFDEIAIVDLPELKSRVDKKGRFLPTQQEFLGFIDQLTPHALLVTQWWQAGATIDIGNRTLEVLHIPGHTPSSMAIFDRSRNQLFVGDFIYPGSLLVGDVDAYIHSTQTLLDVVSEDTKIFTAHALSPGVPLLYRKDLEDLVVALKRFKQGALKSTRNGECGPTYPVNKQITFEVCDFL